MSVATADTLRARIETLLRREWQRRGWLARALWPLSLLFGAIAAARRACYTHGLFHSERLAVPVIVVGNVTVGGTGKTPVVIALVEALRDMGMTPGVVSRGYGARVKQPVAVKPDTAATAVGDEPVLIARRTQAPLWVCPNRVAAARALLAAHPEVDVIISDDGLQHYRLARDVELVVFDHRLGGNGWLLPAGPLREPLSRRRDATLVNDPYERTLPAWPQTYRLMLAADAAWHLQNPSLRRPLTQFTDLQVLAAAGIGAPERFFALLRQHGLKPRTRALADHAAYDSNPFMRESAQAILVTEKDAVKCAGWQDARLWAVPVRALLDPRLVALVVEKVRGRSPA